MNQVINTLEVHVMPAHAADSQTSSRPAEAGSQALQAS